jgi:hypothetical protein
MADLVDQFVAPDSSAFLLNFNIIYLEMGFGRCSVEEQISFVPKLLNNLYQRNATQQDQILFMALSVSLRKYPVYCFSGDRKGSYIRCRGEEKRVGIFEESPKRCNVVGFLFRCSFSSSPIKKSVEISESDI